MNDTLELGYCAISSASGGPTSVSAVAGTKPGSSLRGEENRLYFGEPVTFSLSQILNSPSGPNCHISIAGFASMR